MTDITKLTFKSPIVISVLIGAVTMTAAILKGHFETNSKIDRLSAKFDVYIASNISDKIILNYRVEAVEKKQDNVDAQLDIHSLTLKTIADFIEPKRIEITKRR